MRVLNIENHLNSYKIIVFYFIAIFGASWRSRNFPQVRQILFSIICTVIESKVKQTRQGVESYVITTWLLLSFETTINKNNKLQRTHEN